jgi:hypothetical protein
MTSTTQAQKSYAKEAIMLPEEPPRLAPADWGSGDFLKQRRRHRTYIIWFAMVFTTLSFLGLGVLIGFQVWFRIKTNGAEIQLISDRSLQILAVSVFGQFIGVIILITRSVWSNDEFSLMKNNGS